MKYFFNTSKRLKFVFMLSALAVALLLQTPNLVFAQNGPSASPPVDTISLWSTIQAGGVIGYIIALLSLVSFSLVVEHLVSIRRAKIIPPERIRKLEANLDSELFDDAQTAAEIDGSFLGDVVAAGLERRTSMFGVFDMQTAMQEVSERQISKLYRKLEYLSFIAATAPMLGLLGTVTGMIRSFNTIAQTQGAATPAELASGIPPRTLCTRGWRSV